MLDSLHHVFGSYLASEWSVVCFAIVSDAVESGVGVEVQLARMSNIIRACVGQATWHGVNILSTQSCQTMVCEPMYWDSYGIYLPSMKLFASSTILRCDASSAFALAIRKRFQICNFLALLDPP